MDATLLQATAAAMLQGVDVEHEDGAAPSTPVSQAPPTFDPLGGAAGATQTPPPTAAVAATPPAAATQRLESWGDDDVVPPPHDRQLRASPEAARKRGLLFAAPYMPDAMAGPSPPPPATDRGFLSTAVARAKQVTTHSFRMAVWTYSPVKTRKAALANLRGPQADSYLHRQLPCDLIGVVFSYLSISDLAVASQVCRGWFASADPWAYVEQHGWVPLGPLTRADRVALRVAPTDQHVLPELLRCLRHKCRRLLLQLGNGVAAAAVALPRYRAGADETPPLQALEVVHLERPSPDDLRMLRERLAPRMPALRCLTIERISLPIGARDVVSLVRSCGTHLVELRLTRVINLTRSAIAEMFAVAPSLARVHLDQCVLVTGDVHPQQRPTTSNPGLAQSQNHNTSASHGNRHVAPAPPAANAAKSKVSAVLIPAPSGVAAPWGYVASTTNKARSASQGRRGKAESTVGPPPAVLAGRRLCFAAKDQIELPSQVCSDCAVQGFACSSHAPPPAPVISALSEAGFGGPQRFRAHQQPPRPATTDSTPTVQVPVPPPSSSLHRPLNLHARPFQPPPRRESNTSEPLPPLLTAPFAAIDMHAVHNIAAAATYHHLYASGPPNVGGGGWHPSHPQPFQLPAPPPVSRRAW